MLDLKLLQKHPEVVAKALADRHSNISVDDFLKLDERRRAALTEVETLKSKRNAESAEVARMKRSGEDASALVAELGKLSDRIKELDAETSEIKEQVYQWMLRVPNIPDASVPVGLDENDNPELHRWGTPREFTFPPKQHFEVGAAKTGLDFERGAKLAGSRFCVSHGVFARMERALMNFYLSADPANTASLEALTFHFTAPDGTVYSAVDGSVSALGSPDEAGYYTYFFQTLFFLEDPTAVTLVLEDALWCAKDTQPIIVDLTDGSYAGTLPAGVTALWVEENRGTPVVMVETTISQMPFTSYLGEKGVESLLLQGGVSQTDEADVRRYEYVLEGYEGDAIALIPDYTQETVLDPPLEISLDE